MEPQQTSVASPEPIHRSPSPQSPHLSPQDSHGSAGAGSTCWPVSVLNSCRQHGWWAYLSRPSALFSRAHNTRVDAERPPMFTIAQPKSRAAAPMPNHNMQTQRGFPVRVFKAPTLSSFPYTANAKFDAGYRPTSVNGDPRQGQNWYPARQPPASREPPVPSRFGSWTDNRGGRDTPRPAPTPNYADFIYERSVSSKSDIYSENETSSTTTFTPLSTFSPALSPMSSVTSGPSDVPYRPTTPMSTMNPSSPRHSFPLHIPALAQAQSALRGLFVHPNGDIGQPRRSPTPMPAAPANRTAGASSPPRFFPPDSPVGRTSPSRVLTGSPQSVSLVPPPDYFPPPQSESEVGEAQRLAERNAQQYNSASSTYYQSGLRVTDNDQSRFNGGHSDVQHDGRERSPESLAQMGFSSRSVASSSFPEESSDSQAHLVYESSSLAGNSVFISMTPEPSAVRLSPTASQPWAGYVGSESSSTTAVESEARWRDSRAPGTRNVPVSQLVELGSPNPGDREVAERGRVMSDPGRYEELRGLNILSEHQREAYVNAFAPGTQLRGVQFPVIPTVMRSDSGEGTPTISGRTRRNSGNLWSSLPQLPVKRSPVQVPSRPSSTPPLPRIDTSGVTLLLPPPNRRPIDIPILRQSPPRRDLTPVQPQPPQTALPISSARTRTPIAGPRVLPAEPHRRRSDGDQPLNTSPILLKRRSGMFHRSSSPENAALPREASAPRPSRSGALPLDPQRRQSDSFQSVVPPRSTTPPLQDTATPRNVRWNENLVCPSPIFPSQRRKGWFNRRGDQLWTNDGAYKPPPAGQEFPPDLRDYPPYGSGWMNEEGVRIDMGHRLIPKAPLRSALKQTQQRGPVIQVNNGN